MCIKILTLIALLAIPANAAVFWNIGVDDDAQDGNGDPGNGLNDMATLNGISFNLSGVQENGPQNDLPGNPANAGGPDGDPARDVDDDFYFEGVYDTVVDGGAYAPVGMVAASESYYERALTNADSNMRWHFNLPDTVTEDDNFTFTIDFFNLSESNDADVSSYELTFWVNGTQIGEMQPHLDVDLSSAQSWNFDLDDLGGVDQVGEGFDHYVEIRSTSTGSARWASLDYVQLEISSDPIVEDDPNLSVARSLSFGDLPVDSDPSTESVVITNTGLTQDLVITELAIGGDNPDSFALNDPVLPITVAPGAETEIEVTVTPGSVEQSLSAVLTVTSNDESDETEDIFLSARVFIPFADEGTLWFIGVDDDTQDGNGDGTLNDPSFFNGTDFFTSGVQESGEDFLPGNPDSQGGAGAGRDVDDDYYFAGVYNTVVDGGTYTPVGVVEANERYWDRALTNGDPNMRWHFNLPNSVGPDDAFTFTIDFYNLDDNSSPDISGYDLTFWVDGNQIGDTQTHSEDDLSAAQSWEFTLDDLGGPGEVGPGFDHYVEIRSQPVGGSRWSSLDYAKLDIQAGAVRELIITEITVDKDTNDVTFSFQAKIGETYIIERSTSLKPINEPGGWLELEDSLIAESETETYTDPGAAADGERFF